MLSEIRKIVNILQMGVMFEENPKLLIQLLLDFSGITPQKYLSIA